MGRYGQAHPWTHPCSFDQPSLISGPGHSSAFSEDHERLGWKQVRTSPAGTETRYYVESLYAAAAREYIDTHRRTSDVNEPRCSVRSFADAADKVGLEPNSGSPNPQA
jgi:hypothetical protein